MSDLKNVIFVHIPRTAGTSVSSALGIYKKEQRHFFARKYIALKPNWNECFKFSIVRNPWDRAVSLFMHQTKGQIEFKHWLMEIVKKDGHPKDKTQEWKLTDKMSSTGGTGIPWKCQTDWLIDDEGKICLDFVMRYENLRKDFEKLCDVLGKEPLLARLNDTRKGHYTKFYDTETRQIVADWHRKDIANFSYSFDGVASIL